MGVECEVGRTARMRCALLCGVATAGVATTSWPAEQCENLNTQRNVDMGRTHEITRAVLCDTKPTPCVTEMLFSHELYWSEERARAVGGIKCARWSADDDWPGREPHLSRAAVAGRPAPSGLWESVLQHLPNRTLWMHGDSITTQACEAALCSLVRSRVVRQPLLCTQSGRHPSTPPCPEIDRLSRTTEMQVRGVQLPNGARLLCSAVGVFEPSKVEAVLEHADVAVLNYGLHYHSAEAYDAMLRQLFGLMSRWASGRPGRVPLFRELSAQHFKGGAWAPGADKPPHGTPCQCEPLRARDARTHDERKATNQNLAFNAVAAAATADTGVGLVPFYNLTAPRHDMHRRHFCSYSNQRKCATAAALARGKKRCGVGRCCDCTHLCYTPLLWDVFFGQLRDAMLSHPNFDAGGRAWTGVDHGRSARPRSQRRSSKGRGRAGSGSGDGDRAGRASRGSRGRGRGGRRRGSFLP